MEAVFCEEFTREVTGRVLRHAPPSMPRREIERIDRELQKLLQHIVDGHGDGRTIAARMKELEARQDELRSFLAEAEEPPALLHPEMAIDSRRQVAELHGAVQEGSEAKRLRAAEALRSLIGASC